MSMTMNEILVAAREIYEKTEHSTDCCGGDFDGAMEYIDGAVGEMVQQMVNLVADGLLIAELTRVGLNGFGDVVMLCELCDETYAKKVQGKTMKELWGLKSNHKCKRENLGG